MSLEADESERVAEATRRMQLKHMVITAVARDDLADGGAAHFQKVIEQVREVNPEVIIEVLVPDFKDEDGAINTVIAARPDIFNHNLETVRSLTSKVRSVATYERSLSVLSKVKKRASEIYTKSGLMLGLGETKEELLEAMTDLRSVGCDLLTLGQYLQPTKNHLKIEEFIHPDQFTEYKRIAEAMGFSYVASGPLVRSSYHADDFVPEGFASRS
jgi:lipoic acid synthetase